MPPPPPHKPPPPPPSLSHQPAPFIAEALTSFHIRPDFDSYHGRPLLVSDRLNDSIYLIKYRDGRGMLRMRSGFGRGEWSMGVFGVGGLFFSFLDLADILSSSMYNPN